MSKVLKKDSILRALKKLTYWFEAQKRILPWRDQPTFYRVWISEVMLQQTQVVTVVPYFEKFLFRFPNVESLAHASEEDVLLLWSGLGYYARARRLHRAAQQIVIQGFPQTLEGWLALPGIGKYTAGAILSIAGHQPEPILDGNVERVLSRVYRLSRDFYTQKQLWSWSLEWVQTGYQARLDPSTINQALMELGATLCSVRQPRCEECPLKQICEAAQWSQQALYPTPKLLKQWIEVQETLYCVFHKKSGQVLLRQRAPGEWRAGLWDFLETLPQSYAGQSDGSVITRHVVTRHRIQRITQIHLVSHLEEISEREWVVACQPHVPVGSAFQKTWKAVQIVVS